MLVDHRGMQVLKGEQLTDFRGEKWRFIQLIAAPTEGKSGRIEVEGFGKGVRTFYFQVFPSLKWAL